MRALGTRPTSACDDRLGRVVDRLYNDPSVPNPKRVGAVVDAGRRTVRRPLQESDLALDHLGPVLVANARHLAEQEVGQVTDPFLAAEDARSRQDDHVVRIVPGEVSFNVSCPPALEMIREDFLCGSGQLKVRRTWRTYGVENEQKPPRIAPNTACATSTDTGVRTP